MKRRYKVTVWFRNSDVWAVFNITAINKDVARSKVLEHLADQSAVEDSMQVTHAYAEISQTGSASGISGT